MLTTCQKKIFLRHKWTKYEIQTIQQLRMDGLKFKEIARRFFVTPNAVRKALQRHLNFKIHTTPQQNIPINVTKDFANNWAKNNIQFTDTINNFSQINQYRVDQGLPIFHLRT